MDETTFEYEAAQLAEASRRFPAHRRKVPPSRIQTSTSATSVRQRAPSSAGMPGTRAVTSEVSHHARTPPSMTVAFACAG